MASFYELSDNQALIRVIMDRREDGQSFEHLVRGDARKAIEQLTADDTAKLEQLTSPRK